MQEDNIYPRNGEWYTRQTAQNTAVDPEEKAVNEKRDIIEEVVRWFDEQRAHLDSVESITPSPDTNPDDFMRAWMVNRGVKELLESKQRELEALLQDYPAK